MHSCCIHESTVVDDMRHILWIRICVAMLGDQSMTATVFSIFVYGIMKIVLEIEDDVVHYSTHYHTATLGSLCVHVITTYQEPSNYCTQQRNQQDELWRKSIYGFKQRVDNSVNTVANTSLLSSKLRKHWRTVLYMLPVIIAPMHLLYMYY